MMKFKFQSAMLGFGVRQAGLFLSDWLTRKPSRPQQVLDYLLEEVPAGNAQAVLDGIDEFARTRRFLMNVGDQKGDILLASLAESGAGDVLELGTFCGYSALLMASRLADDGHVDSLEANGAYAAIARKIVEHAGLSSKITIHHGHAREVIPTLNKQYDLVFIDHWKDLYLADLQVIETESLLKPGTHVVADNIGMFDATDYLDYVRNCGHYDCTHHESYMEYSTDVLDAVEVSVYR